MTDLMQGVVEHGTGQAARLGRPTAGKTGTTTSNKDGWFLGFSSGITTGVWMGRDDSRALPGLSGGRAPARAFHDYMIRAVANRPAEPLVTEAAAPDWQIEQNEEFFIAPPPDDPMVDIDGYPADPEEGYGYEGVPQEPAPVPVPQPQEKPGGQEPLDRDWLDRALDRPRPPPPPRDRPPRDDDEDSEL
jgi:penicillin-binding protein 1A